uniref:Uncharacterized protein n=1 Tax=Spumella elongata TaxID=89044 RepID=A0A7S3M3Z2_9STRA|mmetsp:Transcript_25682/g.44154  ORF Transcript_25682/g.44154 Transcript_25682/m.44154 type:complete len:317 (+) Transcript_25682:61-1011(+)
MNMKVMQTGCDWAAIFYDGTPSEITRFCNKGGKTRSEILHHNATGELVFCQRAKDTLNRPQSLITTADGTKNITQALSVPKSALYTELLPLLANYASIFIMDEDISLKGFDFKHFMRIWKCSFESDFRPLIVQPLIVERTQYFPYVYAGSWNATKSLVYSASTGLVEQQVPFFDSTFLEWFIRHVLVHTREVALAQGVDQSLDRTWCRAASFYAAQVMHQNYTKRGDACAVIVGGPNTTAVHHLNTRALQNKLVNRDLYRQKAQVVNEHYKFLFPTWVQSDIGRPVNPLDRILGKKYRKYLTLNTRCLEQYALDQM